MLKLEDVSKMYRLGLVGSATLQDDFKRMWYKARGKEDPFLKIGEENKRDALGGDYVWALKDINFEVEQGEVLGIIGKNGAGKSTLLKLLSKVTKPSTGTIKTRGRIASLLEVGTGFHPELTGRENIFLNGAILGMKKHEIKVKFDEIVDFSGCERYIDTPVKRYSSGMYVRLAFAVAAHLDPEILVVDEVLAVGDAEFQKKAIGKMQDIAKGQGRTVLFVSHNMASMNTLCNQGVLLKNGTITSKGEISDIINQYVTSETDNLISSANFINSTNKNTYIKKAELNNSFFEAKSPLEILLTIESKIEIRNTLVAIAILDELNTTIIHIANKLVRDENLNINPGKTTVKFIIPQLGLKEGTYSINLFLRSKSEIIDWLQNVLSFKVEESSIYPFSVDFKLQGKFQPQFNFNIIA